MMQRFLVGVIVFAGALEATAQGGKGRDRRVNWSDSIPDSGGLAKNSPKRFILIYVRPAEEPSDPTEFRNQDVVDASNESFTFVKLAYDKESTEVKEYRIPGAPMLIGCDKFGNEVTRQVGFDIVKLRAILSSTPENVLKLEATLKSASSKLEEAVKTGDRGRIVKGCLDVLKLARKGYPELKAAADRIDALAAEEWKKVEIAESVDDAKAIEVLEAIAHDFAGTPPSAQAEIQVAQREHKAGSVAAAIVRLGKVVKSVFKKEADEAQKAIEAIAAEGVEKVETAHQFASQDKEKAREQLKKIQKDYAGTEASKKALEALRAVGD
jgi:hypothetical protein